MPSSDNADERISHEEFGARFFEHAVSDTRILGALEGLTGDEFEFGPIGAGPAKVAKVSAKGVFGTPSATRRECEEISFRLTIPVELDLHVDLGVDHHHFATAGIDREVGRFVAKYVKREVDKPGIRAARDTDVASRVDRAWKTWVRPAIGLRPQETIKGCEVRMRTGGGKVVAVACLVAAMAAAEPAGAAPKVSYVKKTFSLAPEDEKFKTAKCRGGKSVIGGGFDGGPGDDRLSYLMSSRPVDGRDRGKEPDDGWRVGVRSFNQTVQGSVFAACAKTNPRYDSSKAFGGDAGPGEISGGAASCARPLGGGISIPERAIGAVSENYSAQFSPQDFGWSAAVDIFVGTFTPRIWLVCGPPGTRTRERTVISEENTQHLRETAVEVSCPARTRVSSVGGLGYNLDPGENFITELNVTSNGRGARAAVAGPTGTRGGFSALCVKRLPRR